MIIHTKKRESLFMLDLAQQTVAFRQLFSSHLINLNAFFSRENQLSLKDISAHVAWAYNNVYSHPFHTDQHSRTIHGIQHAARTAFYIPILANLYRKYGYDEALSLTEEDIQLLQITALFHDAGREGDGDDLWDHKSAIALYVRLTSLGVDQMKAKLLAEAIANKDYNTYNRPGKTYFEINEINGVLSWEWVPSTNRKKNIFQHLIHDADCLDIMRIRDTFDSNYLDFVQLIEKNNPTASNDIGNLIAEVSSLIHIQGDAYHESDNVLKEARENENAYQHIMDDIDPKKHPILHKLNASLLSQASLQTMNLFSDSANRSETEQHFNTQLRQGKILVRSVTQPSDIDKKHPDSGDTQATLELRKILRRQGVAASFTSKKSDVKEKYGNDARSTTFLWSGVKPYGCVGWLMTDTNVKQIKLVSKVNAFTGTGKKPRFKLAKINQEEINQAYSDLTRDIKLGGSIKISITPHFYQNHNEIVYDITHIDGIYFTNDPTAGNHVEGCRVDGKPISLYSPLLQAIYLRSEYEAVYNQRRDQYRKQFGNDEKFLSDIGEKPILPILEYSSIHHTFKEISNSELTDEKMFFMWEQTCRDFIQFQLNNYKFTDIQSLTIDEIKKMSIYGSTEGSLLPPDIHYSPELKQRINQSIEHIKQSMLDVYQKSIPLQIMQKTLPWHEVLFLIKIPILFEKYKQLLFDESEQDFYKDKIKATFSSSDMSSIKDFIKKIDAFMLLNANDTNKKNQFIYQLKMNIINAIIEVATSSDSKDFTIDHFLYFIKHSNLGSTDKKIFLSGIQDQIGDLIQNGEQLGQVLEELTDNQTDIIFNKIESRIDSIIQTNEQLYRLLRNPKLSHKHKKMMLEKIGYNIGNIIKSYEQLDKLLHLDDNLLNDECKKMILENITPHASDIIENYDQLSYLLIHSPLLSNENKLIILKKSGDKLVHIIENYARLYRLLESDSLSVEHKTIILENIKDNLDDIITDAGRLYILLESELLNDTFKKIILENIIPKLEKIITFYDLYFLYIEHKTLCGYKKILFENISPVMLSNIIQDSYQLSMLLNRNILDEDKTVILTAIKHKLKEIVKSSSDLKPLLDGLSKENKILLCQGVNRKTLMSAQRKFLYLIPMEARIKPTTQKKKSPLQAHSTLKSPEEKTDLVTNTPEALTINNKNTPS